MSFLGKMLTMVLLSAVAGLLLVSFVPNAPLLLEVVVGVSIGLLVCHKDLAELYSRF